MRAKGQVVVVIGPSEEYFTKYPNPILEKSCKMDLRASQFRVLQHIIRMTLGWHEKSGAPITYRQFVKATGLHRNTVIGAVKKLEDQRIILKVPVTPVERGRGDIYSVNLNTDEWLESPPRDTGMRGGFAGSLPRPASSSKKQPKSFKEEFDELYALQQRQTEDEILRGELDDSFSPEDLERIKKDILETRRQEQQPEE